MHSDWNSRVAAIQAGVVPLRFLEGNWTGHGTSDGAAITGRITAQMVLGDSFLECSEQLFDASGGLDHEDRVLYRYDLEDQTLRALHLQAPGWVAERHVDLLPDNQGFVWSGGPTLPRVVVTRRTEDQVQVAVWLPGESSPVTALEYTRAS